MSSFIISGSRGSDDPTMATLPFIAAKTAKEAGHDVTLWLWNEAVLMSRKGGADHIKGVNLLPLKDILESVLALGIPIWVCGACAYGRGMVDEDLIPNSVIKAMPDYINATLDFDKSITF